MRAGDDVLDMAQRRKVERAFGGRGVVAQIVALHALPVEALARMAEGGGEGGKVTELAPSDGATLTLI